MANLTTTINIQIDKEEKELHQYFTEEELEKTAEKLIYIEKHPEEYKGYKNISELKKTLSNNE